MDEATLPTVLRDGGAAAVLAAIASLPARERVALLRFGVRKIAFDRFPPTFLDDMIAMGDAAIALALELGEDAEANVLAFNLSANLCDCWGDAYERDARHFDKGLAYADRALELRLRLGVPQDKVALAHWARGKHLLSLRRYDESVAAFVEHLGCLTSGPASGAQSPSVAAAEAYLAIAREAAGDATQRAEIERAMSTLKAQLEDPTHAEDAKVYFDQLLVTRARLALA